MKHLTRPLMIAAALLWSASLNAAIMNFSTTLSGAGENPDVVTAGTGTAQVTIDTIALTMAVHVEFSGLTGTTVDAHIHCCIGPLDNTSVAVGFIPAGFPLGVTADVFDAIFDLSDSAIYTAGFLGAFGGGTAAGAAAALIDNMRNGLAYVNVHTTFVRSGEIRGQLELPEPGTLLLLGVAGLLGFALRQRST